MFKDLNNRISQLADLNNAESKLVSYFQEANEQLALQHIQDISKGSGISQDTVIMFINRLGFLSFSDFSQHLKQALLERVGLQWERFQRTREKLFVEEDDLWSRFSRLVANELKACHANIPSKKMESVAQKIMKTKGTVYVMGQLNSYTIAYLFWQQLLFPKPDAVFLDNQITETPEHRLSMEKDDLLFAVSYASYSHETTLTVKDFAAKGAQVIVLTDSDDAPVCKWADICLVVPIEWNAMMKSRCSGLMVVEALSMYLKQILRQDLDANSGNMDFVPTNLENTSNQIV